MAKKRQREEASQDVENGQPDERMDEDDSSDEEDFDVVNVNFEWFNFDPEIDFHGVKRLLQQLLDVDAPLFDLSGLAELIVQQNTVGSAVKVDEKANDPYAFLSVLNLAEHREKKPVADLTQYLTEKAKTTGSLSMIPELLSSGSQVGLILAERLVNMPSEIAPPMFSMLIDEIEAAVEDKEPYAFSHYLILSKTYQEVESNLDQGERKTKKAKDVPSRFYFHPEDEVLEKHALARGTFSFTKDDEAVADSKRAFQEMGIKSQGLMILIEAGKFGDAVKGVAEHISS